MRRARAMPKATAALRIATIVLGSPGIMVTPVVVSSHLEKVQVLGDCGQSVLWMLSGRHWYRNGAPLSQRNCDKVSLYVKNYNHFITYRVKEHKHD